MTNSISRVWWESWLLVTLGLVDLASTVYLVLNGMAVEANPILTPYLSWGVQWFIVAKGMLLVLVPIGMVEWLKEAWPSREFRLRVILRFGLALYVLIYIAGSVLANFCSRA